MILSGDEIRKRVHDGSIVIEPFEAERITTNSYDFRLGNTLAVYRSTVLDPHQENAVDEIELSADGLLLKAGGLYLGSTLEKLGSTSFVPIIKGRSSIARLGLFIHATADLIDIGSINQWTLQLIPTLDVWVYPGMSIGQVTFWSVLGKIRLYSGKYQGSVGPIPSLIHLDKRQ